MGTTQPDGMVRAAPAAKTSKTVRTALWHLRHGGLGQVRSWANSQNEAPEESAEGISFPPATLDTGFVPRNPAVRAAVILDDFSALAFGAEWDCTQLSRKTWRDQMDAHDFNLLFVESAWSGFKKEWFGKLDGASHDGSELSEIVSRFRKQGIATVFWNKEDPVHYNDFLAAAQLFDHVFTTDADKIPQYHQDLGHCRVGLLPFAAQPRLHNPVRPESGWHERDVAFGGMYFSEKYDSRRAQMDLLLGTAARFSPVMPHGLEIFSRQLGGAEKYQFPAGLNDHVVGSLSYPQMLTAYKAYKAMFNVNTVTESSTMCARRVFEILACGTSVISTPSKALTHLFEPGEIQICATEEDVEQAMEALLRDPFANERGLHLAQRRIWQGHTYRHRSETILAEAAPHLSLGGETRRVTAVVLLEEEAYLEHVFEMLGLQLGVELELVLVGRGFELSDAAITELQDEHGIAEVLQLESDAGMSRGACLNQGIAAGTGDVVALIEAADYYAPHYLMDQLYALDYSQADVVGKRAHYSVHPKTGAGKWKKRQTEHHWTTEVLGTTITAPVETFQAMPFADLELEAEADFLNRVTLDGASIYSADRWNYLRAGTALEAHQHAITL